MIQFNLTILNSISLKNTSNAELVKVINTVQDYILLSGTYITKPYDISDILKNIDKIITALQIGTTTTAPVSSKRVTNLGGKSIKRRKSSNKKRKQKSKTKKRR